MTENNTDQENNELPLFACCDEFNNRIPTHGDGIDRGSVNGVTVQFFEDGGHLCFHDLIIDGISNPFGVTIDIDGNKVYGKVKATGKFTSTDIVYVSPSGNFYKGKLESSIGFENHLVLEGVCDTPPVDDIFEGLFPIATFKNAFSIYYDSESNEIIFKEAYTLDTIYKATAIIPHEEWTHLAVVRKGETLRFYLNGKKVGDDLPNDINYGKPESITVGRGTEQNGEYSYFLGEIDSLKVINNFVKYHANFEPDNINGSILPKTPTPTSTPTPTPTATPTPTPTETPVPEKTLRVYSNIKDLASSVKFNNKETYVDEFHSFEILPGTEIHFLPGPNAEHKFLRLHGQTDWIDGFNGKMPEQDVDVYFEYKPFEFKDYMEDCKTICPCDDSVVAEMEIDDDPRIDLKFFEHIDEKKEFRRVVEFEAELPTVSGIDCEYDVTMINDDLLIKNKETKSEYAWRDLIFVRNNKYKFNFDENEVIFKIYDQHGTELGRDDGFYNTEEWIYPLIVLPTDKTPDFLYYELINKTDTHRGRIQVKNINHISGVVTGYNYVFGSKTDISTDIETLKQVSTYKNGVYHIGLDSYVDANELNIESTSGLEPVLESNVNVQYKSVSGYLDTNILTTLFHEVLSETKNYIETHHKIKKFLGLNPHFDLLKHDFITTFLWTSDLSFHELARILFFNVMYEYASKSEKSDKFMEVIVNQIVDASQHLKFTNDYYVADLLETCELDARFSDMFSLVYVKSTRPKHRSLKQELFDLYSNVYYLKDAVIKPDNFSIYMLQESYDREVDGIRQMMNKPMIVPEKILLKSEDCTNPQLGKFVVRKLDDLLTKSVFDETQVDFEMLRKLHQRTLRIYALQKSFCYTIIPHSYNLMGIFDEVDSYKIYGDFEESEECCDIVKRNEGYVDESSLNVVTTEQSIMPLKLIEAGSSRIMLSEDITNMSHPVEKIHDNQYRFYIDKSVSAGNVMYSSPGYFTTNRDTANKIMYRGIDVGYNSGEKVRQVRSSAPDYIETNILTTWMVADGTLNLVTDINPRVRIGDYVTIREGLKNAAINGSYRVSEVSENSFAIQYRVPINMEIKDMQGLNGKFDASYATRVYMNVTNLSINDELIFDYASGGGKRFSVINIGQDEYGVYALVKGVLSEKAKVAVKSHFNLSDENFVKFTYETKVSYYNVSKTNPQTDSLWMSHLPDVTPDGRFNDDVSFVQVFHEDMSAFTGES